MEHVLMLDGGESYASVPGAGGGGGGGGDIGAGGSGLVSGGSGVLSGGSSILMGGSVPAERFTNSTASWERREERKQRIAMRRIVPGRTRFRRGEARGRRTGRASTAPEQHEDPGYSVYLPTIGVEVTAAAGRFKVTQRRSPDRRVWRERNRARPPPMVGPTMSVPSMEDLDGFDKHYGDGPTPIISAAPRNAVRVRPLDYGDAQRAIRSSGEPHGGHSNGRGGLGDMAALRGAVGTLADYFEQQGPRKADVVWAGDGGNRPGTGFGTSRPATVGFGGTHSSSSSNNHHHHNSPLAAASSGRPRKKKSGNKKNNRGGVARSSTAPSHGSGKAHDDYEFSAKQKSSPYWTPPPKRRPRPKYEARPMTVGSSRVEGRHINMEELLLSPEQRQLLHEDADSLEARRQYLSTPDLNAVARDFGRLQQMGSRGGGGGGGMEPPDIAVFDGGDGSFGDDGGMPPRHSSTSQGLRNTPDKKRSLKRALSRQRPRTVQAYVGNSPSSLRDSVSSASARFGISQNPKHQKAKKSQRASARPGSSASVRSDKSEVYTSCAMCHRQRSRFSDFCNVCLRKMDTRRRANTADRRAAWVREGKSATFILEIGSTGGATIRDAGPAATGRGHTAPGSTRPGRGGGGGGGATGAAVDVAITRLTFNEAVSAAEMLRQARMDAVAAAKARGKNSLHGWMDALAMSSEANHAIKRVQACFRGFHFRARFRRGRHAVVVLQSYFHGARGRAVYAVRFARWHAAIEIQTLARGMLVRAFWNFETMRPAAIIMQCAVRQHLARNSLQYLKDEVERKRRKAAAWSIQCAARQRLARNAANFRRNLRDGAKGMQKTFRMYVVRKWFLYQKYNATIIQSRFMRRRLAQDRCDRLRDERDGEARKLRAVQDKAITKVQTVARVWLAYRAVDRLREKYDDAMETLESASDRFDETGARGEWPDENLYMEYGMHLMYTVKETNDAARNFRAGIGRLGESALLLYGYAILLTLRRSESQNDVAEAKRRQKMAIELDPLRKSARRLELLFRCMIKMDGLNPMVLASYAVFHQILRNHATAINYFQRAIKLDPYDDHIVAAFADLQQLETRKRAIVRGETPSSWFTEGDFAFEELALDEVERSVPYSTAGAVYLKKVQADRSEDQEMNISAPPSSNIASAAVGVNKRLRFTCKTLGENVMIEGVQIWKPPSALLVELGLASPYRPDDFPDPAPIFRMFLTDKDVRLFVKVLDMKELLHARNQKRLLNMILQRAVLVPPATAQQKNMALGIEFRQEPWVRVGIVTKSKIYMTLVAHCVDFVAERLAREDLRETQALADAAFNSDSDEDEGASEKEKKKKKKKKKKKQRKSSQLSKEAQRKKQLEAFKKNQRSGGTGNNKKKKKRRKKSVFDVVALPEELERLVAEQMAVKKEVDEEFNAKEKAEALAAGSRPGSRGSTRPGSRGSARSRSSRANSRPNSRQSNRSRQSGGSAKPKKTKRKQTDIERLSEIGINDPDSDENSSDDEETLQKRRKRPDVVNKRLARGRHILFVGHIPKLKKTWKIRVDGTLIRRMFCDKPALLRQFLLPGWRIGARPLVIRLAQMLDLVASGDTPRVYEKKYVMVDGKFQETVVDVTPAHEPTRRLVLVGLRERMLEATRNIAATEIQRIIRGITGRAFARNVVPQTNARHIQRCWRGRVGRVKAERRFVAVTRFRGARGMQNVVRSHQARTAFQNHLRFSMPFSGGRWEVAWGALRIQRESVEDYLGDPNNLVACFRASLFRHTLSTPTQSETAAQGYLRVLEGHAGHNASLHFCIGVLLLAGHSMPGYIDAKAELSGFGVGFGAAQAGDDAQQKVAAAAATGSSSGPSSKPKPNTDSDVGALRKQKSAARAKQQDEWDAHQALVLRRAHEHVRKGYEMDPGGRRFGIVEQAYFERAANIHTEDFEAQLSYGVLLLEVRRDATKALFYLRRAQTLIDAVCARHAEAIEAFHDEELRSPNPERRAIMASRSEQVEEARERVHYIARRSMRSVKGMEKLWVPVQALWRGHWDRCRRGLAVKAAVSQVRQSRLPGDARRVLRLALSFHCVFLNYELADGMYRKAIKIDPKDPCALYAHAVLLAALLASHKDHSKGGGEKERNARKRRHQGKLQEIESLVAKARKLDKGERSYQWMESEFFVRATHRAWDPAMATVHRRSLGDQKMLGSNKKKASSTSSKIVVKAGPSGSASSPSKLRAASARNAATSKDLEAGARCSCNYALFLQWVRDCIGDANEWFTKALADSPGDAMVNGCYEEFFNRGMAFTLTDGEVSFANALQNRLFGRRKTRKEREERLRRLEEERVKRITVQEMEKERKIRQDAIDRIVEDRRRQEMLKHDLRLMGRLKNIQNQRKSILGGIGKSQAEIAAERKKARAEAKKKKKKKDKKKKKKKE